MLDINQDAFKVKLTEELEDAGVRVYQVQDAFTELWEAAKMVIDATGGNYSDGAVTIDTPTMEVLERVVFAIMHGRMKSVTGMR